MDIFIHDIAKITCKTIANSTGKVLTIRETDGTKTHISLFSCSPESLNIIDNGESHE